MQNRIGLATIRTRLTDNISDMPFDVYQQRPLARTIHLNLPHRTAIAAFASHLAPCACLSVSTQTTSTQTMTTWTEIYCLEAVIDGRPRSCVSTDSLSSTLLGVLVSLTLAVLQPVVKKTTTTQRIS